MSKRELSTKGSKINLAQKDGAIYKKTLLCRTGEFQGSNGDVEVTTELLTKLCDHYNTQRAKPQNENDFAPILLDHARLVENVKGRLMAGLYVAPWENPETGEMHDGLYGDLRVDLEDAIKKVESGIYSQVSLSFDEDTGEIFEVSFVAVEAARRAQVLSKGEKKMDFEKKFKTLSASHEKFKTGMKTLNAGKKATCLAMKADLDGVETEIKNLSAAFEKNKILLKSAAIKAQLKGFIKLGKMTKAEFKEIKVNELAALPESGVKALMSSFEKREVSSDVIQHGQADAKPMVLTTLSSKDTRALIKAQKEGKALSAIEPEKEVKKELSEEEKKKLAEQEGDESLSSEDIDDAVKHSDSMNEAVSKMSGAMKKMGEMLKKLMDSEKDENELEETTEEETKEDKKEGAK